MIIYFILLTFITPFKMQILNFSETLRHHIQEKNGNASNYHLSTLWGEKKTL